MSDRPAAEKMIRDFIVSNFLFRDAQIHVSDDDSLIGMGIIDSTGIQELAQFLEVTFCVRILDEEIIPENMDSITNIARFLRKKTEGHPS
jgi:acyl carrier protein